jgi:hypothetical protein
MEPVARYVQPVKLLAALAIVLALACQRGPGPVHVEAIRVAKGALADAMREAGIDDAALETSARAALGAARFRLEPGQRAYRAGVDVLSVRIVPGDGGARVEVTVEIELAPVRGEAATVREAGTGSRPISNASPAEAFRAALDEGSARAAEALALAFAAEEKPAERLIEDLAAPDPRVRDHAVRALAERRSAAAVPALIQRLQDPDPDVVQRAIGALAQIRDPRAVGPLIDASRRGDPGFTASVARVIGDVGGPEAEGYLLTLESGHPDPRVRHAAHDALAEMSARQAAGAPVATGR